jgi:hypothetical protein
MSVIDSALHFVGSLAPREFLFFSQAESRRVFERHGVSASACRADGRIIPRLDFTQVVMSESLRPTIHLPIGAATRTTPFFTSIPKHA